MKVTMLLPLLLLLPLAAEAEEEAAYVGGGRYACDSDSLDCAVLRQRNEEQTRHLQEREEDEQRYDGEERREAEYRRDYETGGY